MHAMSVKLILVDHEVLWETSPPPFYPVDGKLLLTDSEPAGNWAVFPFFNFLFH